MRRCAFRNAAKTFRTFYAPSLHPATRSVRMASQAAGAGLDPRAGKVLSYWCGEDWATAAKYKLDQACMKKWFGGGVAVDKEIIDQFSSLHSEMAAGSLDTWLEHPANALAGVILMDQFSRNMFRGSPQTYALDAKAVTWAKHILDTKMCDDFPLPQRFFLAMPFDHSEEVAEQERCVALNKAFVAETTAAVAAGDPDGEAALKFMNMTLGYAIAHYDVVAKWGRFPHRNVVLGREATPEEVAGLADGSIRSFA